MGGLNAVSSPSLAVGALVLASGVNARLYDVYFPHATTAMEFPALEGLIPKPTPNPVDSFDVRRRQARIVETVLVAPDQTCGYVDGSITPTYTCHGADSNCMFITAVDNLPGAVACCNSAVCGFRVGCYDDEQVSSGRCTGNCLFNTAMLKCTHSASPYCNSISFSSNIWDFFCDANPGFYEATTTYHGQTDAEEWGEVLVTLSDPGVTSDADTTTRTSSSDVTSTTASPTAGDDDDDDEDGEDDGGSSRGGGGDGSDNNDDNDDDNDNDRGGSGFGSGNGSDNNNDDGDNSSTPVGAIVGGTVGGVAGLALLGVLAWFLIRRHKKNDAQQQPPAAAQMQQAPAPQNTYPPPGVSPAQQFQQPSQHPASPNPHQSYYEPTKFGYVQNTQQVPPPGPSPGHDPYAQYAQPAQPAPPPQQQPAGGHYPPAGLAPQQPVKRKSVSPSFVSAVSSSGANNMSSAGPGSPDQGYPPAAAGYAPGPGQQTIPEQQAMVGQQTTPGQATMPGQQPIYEAGMNTDHHRGEMHELA